MAKRERKSVHHVEMTDGKRAIIQGLERSSRWNHQRNVGS